ncbi:sorting nexin-7-like [Sinocyclocheilus rhinocerous]|uniref:sorting nexin-7-like n=1 Tax=Sinocyclocheilus rhinocerous TaxID=307959 RepID=UPI0007B9C672|nr:PREDICTED: sorting nexin-7-like [Sinocyclocheilus rhinocerous]
MSGSVVDNTVSSGNSSVAIPTDISGQILDLDEDDDLEVFSKIVSHQPLPEKFVMKGMVERFNEDFIETRRSALHKFLNKIAEHPIFSSSEDFKIFLTAGSGELTSHKKQGPGFLSRMGETVKAVAAAVRGVRSRPQEFTDMQEYAEAFSQKISSIDKVTQRIVREQKEYLEELKECGPTYALWSQSEEELAEPLKNVAGCVDKCCKETEEQVKHLNDHLIPVLHEYVLCADTLKAVLRRRDNIQADFEAKTEALASKKADRDADSKVLSLAWDSLVGRSPEEVKQQKQQKFKGEIKEMRDELDKVEDRLEWANNALKSDWTRWQKGMRTDLRSAFIDTAERNVSYYEKCLAVWESFLQSQRTDAEGNGNVDFS